jgi:predicted aspartyl protease
VASLSLNIYLLKQVKEPKTVEEALNSFIENPPSSLELRKVKLAKSVDSAIPSFLSSISPTTPKSHQLNNLDDIIKQAIDAHDYFLAANLLYEISLEDKKRLYVVKSYWLSNTMRLLKNKDYLLAKNAIDAFLGYSPDDLDFLTTFVKLKLAKKQVLLAVKKAFSLQYHTFDLDLQRQSIDYAQALVREEIKRLYKLALWFELAQFTEEVLAIAPNSAQAQWALAQAQFQQGDYSLARQSLNTLLNQPNYQVKSQRLLNNIELALQRPLSVPLIRKGDHFIVEGVINDSFSVNLLIDTGASISLLSQHVYDELVAHTKVKYIDDIVLTTAGGQVVSPIYEVDEFSLQGYQVKNLIFAVSPYLNLGNDGLLGMNFLRLFDFHIDQAHNLLRLKNKPSS